MKAIPIWRDTAGETDFPSLQGDLAVDAAIIGAGITGITAAMLLAQAGKRVAVLEAGRVGMGTTGQSTGNLYAVVADYLFAIGEKWGEGALKTVAAARSEAVNLIEATVKRHAIECDFARRPWHLFTPVDERKNIIEKEYQAALSAGLKACLTDSLPAPFQAASALILEDQAQFHPLKYVQGLARAIAAEQCQIFENTKVTAFDDKKGVVETEGGRISAEKIILATHTPKGFNVLQTELGPYREYGIAARLTEPVFPEGIYWRIAPSRRSVRAYHRDGEHYVMVIGEDHKVGQRADTEACYRQLEDTLRTQFTAGEIAYRWSAQHYHSADGLPYIGKSMGSSNLYVATGFGKDGLTYGALAARLICDDIMGRQNAWSDTFNARRFNPAKSAKHFLSENLNVAGYYLKDYLKTPDSHSYDVVGKGEGKLVEVKGEKLAAYRDETGELFLLSPVCTHLRCIVHWNGAEKSWDCPCHGSRFRIDGEVIEGPAIAPLEKKSP